MVLEIRELDSERQALVYNHHHELIAASDTIAAVRKFALLCRSYPELYFTDENPSGKLGRRS